MGAWGAGSFENDEASAWAGNELQRSSGYNAITGALAVAANLDADELLVAIEASIAVAAAEVVAALHGYPSNNLPASVREWQARNTGISSHDPVSLAIKAVERVRSDSALKEQWDAAGPSEWYAAVDDLLKRLRKFRQV